MPTSQPSFVLLCRETTQSRLALVVLLSGRNVKAQNGAEAFLWAHGR